MVFSSLTFLLYFLPLVWVVYTQVPLSYKNLVLCCASLVFYAWGEPVFLLLMVLSIGMNYAFGRLLGMARKAGMRQGLIKIHMGLAVGANLLFLGFFKYAGFVTGLIPGLAPLSVSLPIGISFYTFQAISYIVDVYRKKVEPRRDLLNFALYISFFPQLIAGPIVQYSQIEKQLDRHPAGFKMIDRGVWRFIWGLAKKVLIANPLGRLHTEISAIGGGSPGMAWLGALAFTLQIYYDFSGYSDMAIGIGRLFGFRFPANFDAPYTAKSVTEFWRRWHMTLSAWFRDYVYIPLGGNRVSRGRHILNLLIVWLLTGLWHGAGLNFILWGLYYALWLILEKYVFGDWLFKHSFISRLYTGLVVVVGWVIFAQTDLGAMATYLGAMIGLRPSAFAVSAAGPSLVRFLGRFGVVLLAGLIGLVPALSLFRERLFQRAKPAVFVIELALGILCLASLVSDSFNPFLYFRF